MYEEQRLISLGFSLEDAFNVCRSMRRVGTLDKFMEEINNLNPYKKEKMSNGKLSVHELSTTGI